MLKITEKLRPYSHQPGTVCLVPKSDKVVCVYPTLFTIEKDFPIRVTGPIREFTVQMDLERDCLWIWGIAKEGHFRLQLAMDEMGLTLFVDRCPKSGIEIGDHHLLRKEKILLQSGGKVHFLRKMERLSLGNWKAQDWDLVRRRNDPREWAPVLFALGQKVPFSQEAKGGPLHLLWSEQFFHAAFSGILVPHLKDPLHQGLFPEDGSGNPIALLTLAYQKIRSFLIQGDQILPELPSDWDCGRVLALETEYGSLDLEWTKGMIRQMVLHAKKSGETAFEFSSQVKSFRFNGTRIERGTLLSIEEGKKYLFDRFQK